MQLQIKQLLKGMDSTQKIDLLEQVKLVPFAHHY
jgi:hypothetical protein